MITAMNFLSLDENFHGGDFIYWRDFEALFIVPSRLSRCALQREQVREGANGSRDVDCDPLTR